MSIPFSFATSQNLKIGRKGVSRDSYLEALTSNKFLVVTYNVIHLVWTKLVADWGSACTLKWSGIYRGCKVIRAGKYCFAIVYSMNMLKWVLSSESCYLLLTLWFELLRFLIIIVWFSVFRMFSCMDLNPVLTMVLDVFNIQWKLKYLLLHVCTILVQACFKNLTTPVDFECHTLYMLSCFCEIKQLCLVNLLLCCFR